MINRKKFYDSVRGSLFNGKITPSQLQGMDAVINEWETSGLTDTRWLAYMFATDIHETAKTMQAIEEYGKGKGRKYGKPASNGKVYFGRGLVQLTWDYNYKKMGKILGIDLYNNPELALDLNIAVKIMFEGMTTGKSFSGDFTGKHLGNYFNKTANDPINARRIINGTDQATRIKGYYDKFLLAIS